MKPNRVIIFFLLLAGALALAYSTVAAQDAKPTPSDDDVNRVAKQMFCPVCENIPLDVCPTQACNEWRELIRLKLSQGWSDDQIKQYFAQQYGDRVLAEPPRRGLNWLVYLLPPLFILVGAFIVFRVLTSMKSRSASSAVTETPPINPSASDDPYLARLEEELRKKE